MNHLKPKIVTVRCMGRIMYFSIPFADLESFKYSEQDLSNDGCLWLSVNDFTQLLNDYLHSIIYQKGKDDNAVNC